MSKLRAAKIFLKFVYEMIKNNKLITEDVYNNYFVCKDFCIKTIEASNINLEVEGIDNIIYDVPLLLASNHKSFFDIILLISIIDRYMPFACAKELSEVPLLGKYINSINSVIINRKETNFKRLKTQLNNIENAINSTGLILFPEGECSYNSDEIKEFKKGAFMSKKDMYIVPTYIHVDKMDFIKKWYVPKKEVKIIFGEAFDPKEELGKVRPHILADYTRNKVLELKNRI